VEFKKSYLSDSLPRLKRFWIRLSDDLVVNPDLVHFLQTLRTSRPDAAVTLLLSEDRKNQLSIELERVSEDRIFIPGHADKRFFKSFRTEYPDFFVTLSDDPRTELEALWMNIPVRIGWEYADSPRPNLTGRFPIEDTKAWNAMPVGERLLTFGRYFGLKTPEDSPDESI
jgi:ADP-heptose:LPS heptosyltransferase